MARVIAVVNEVGAILAARFDGPDSDDPETPVARLQPLSGQQLVEMEIPDEVERLSSPDMARFFMHVAVSAPIAVAVPHIEVVQRDH